MPSNTTSSVFFHYVYVLESFKDKERYIGYTNNLKKRLEEHKKGLSFSTKPRLPFKLIYFEGCLNQEDAKRREHYLKTTQAQYINFDNFQFAAKGGSQSCITGQGRRFLGLRLLEYKRHNKTAFGSGS